MLFLNYRAPDVISGRYSGGVSRFGRLKFRLLIITAIIAG